LQTEVLKLERQISDIRDIKDKQAKLLKRIDVIQALQQQRHLPVQVMNELARVVAPGVYVVRLQITGNRVAIEGFCDSNNHLANMMREVEQARWLANPKVQQIVAASDAPRREHAFKLEVTVLPAGDGPSTDFTDRALAEVSR
jgi:type IV pilus assembly protein PilN